MERLQSDLASKACHQCGDCGPCPEGIRPIYQMIYSDVWYNHYRNMGLQAFLEHPWAAWGKKGLEAHFSQRLSELQACTRCGLCEERCPHHLPIMDMLEQMLEDHLPLIKALRERQWTKSFHQAASPYD